jgi:hypothetical protein
MVVTLWGHGHSYTFFPEDNLSKHPKKARKKKKNLSM